MGSACSTGNEGFGLELSLANRRSGRHTKEYRHVSSPENTLAHDDATAAEPKVQRSHRSWRIAGSLLVILALAFSSAACTPTMDAREAIEATWPAHTVTCAMRVANAESGLRADAMSPGGGNIGLFQVNSVHRTWISNTYGYRWEDLTDPYKNARVAQGLSQDAFRRLGDGWAPWRFGGANSTGCPR